MHNRTNRTRLRQWLAAKAAAQKPKKGARHTLGAFGEELVAGELASSGFEILARNFEVQGIEIDLFCRKHRRFLMFEVKTARYPACPEENLSLAQKRRLYRARAFLARELRIESSRLELLLAAVRVGRGSVRDICFFRIPWEPRIDVQDPC